MTHKTNYTRQEEQLGLPFPVPKNAKIWPNRQGFDIGEIEFWPKGGCRNITTMTYGIGSNWVAALLNLLTHPKQCS